MKVRITCTLIGEDKTDAMNLPKNLEMFRTHVEGLRANGAFGPPDKIDTHILVKPGVWDRG